MKHILVQVSDNNCETCRFNILLNDNDTSSRYCLAYLKAIFRDEIGRCIPVNDCKDIGDQKDEG